ncbi:MAG: riboflavin synthase [Phycisphaeraceae bacterium]
MFTGIVATMGRIARAQRHAFGLRLIIDRSHWRPGSYRFGPGDSVSVSGVCLTVVEATDQTLAFDVIQETLDKTSLGGRKEGDRVNLEHALLPTTPMGGHFVQGHVDGVGHVVKVIRSAEEVRLTVRPPAELMDYIVPKGSVTIDGVSLTIAAVGQDDFDVALIPTTLDITTLGTTGEGDRVNLETDIVSKTIVHWLRRQKSGKGDPVTLDTLRAAGFVGNPDC